MYFAVQYIHADDNLLSDLSTTDELRKPFADCVSVVGGRPALAGARGITNITTLQRETSDGRPVVEHVKIRGFYLRIW